MNFRSACEVADVFAKRLGLDDAVRASLAASFERWNGRGLPTGAKGAAIPRPMRIAQLGQELEVLARIEGDRPGASTIMRKRRGKAYDPELTDVALADGAGWWEQVEPLDPWDAALELAPPRRTARRSRCARGDARAGRLLRPQVAVARRPLPRGRRARRATPAGPMPSRRARARSRTRRRSRTRCGTSRARSTRDERDRAEMHALVTDQLLRRLPYTAAAGRRRLCRARTRRRLRLPPACQRRAPRRRATGARRGRLLSGDDLRPSAPRRAGARCRRGRAARDERGRPPRR